MSCGSLTVQTTTFRPRRWASASPSAVRSRKKGDQTAHPKILTRRGTEPPTASISSPAVQGRNAGPAVPQIVEPRPFHRQAGGRDLRRELAHLGEHAPVERLHLDAIDRGRRTQGRDDGTGELRRPHRLVRHLPRHLDLDVEIEPPAPGPLRQRQRLAQSRHAGAVARHLMGEALRGLAARRGPAHVERGERLQMVTRDTGSSRR